MNRRLQTCTHTTTEALLAQPLVTPEAWMLLLCSTNTPLYGLYQAIWPPWASQPLKRAAFCCFHSHHTLCIANEDKPFLCDVWWCQQMTATTSWPTHLQHVGILTLQYQVLDLLAGNLVSFFFLMEPWYSHLKMNILLMKQRCMLRLLHCSQ
jgi:hypothetical protein